MTFKASWGKSTKVVTLLTVVIVLALIYALLLSAKTYDTGLYIVSLLLFSILFISWGFSTTGYEINEHDIIIKRPFGKITYQKSSVKEIEQLLAKEMKFSIRTFGNGGLFGFYGSFYNKKYGNMKWFVSNFHQLVLLHMDGGKKILVSPDNPEDFIAAISK